MKLGLFALLQSMLITSSVLGMVYSRKRPNSASLSVSLMLVLTSLLLSAGTILAVALQ